jgi:hypothetical protein
VGYGTVNKGDEGKEIWLMDFISLYEIEQRNFLQLPEAGQGEGCGERQWGQCN